ncbi:MAG: hypothetical protein V1754_15585 [Pseudomonadota bacterium]
MCCNEDDDLGYVVVEPAFAMDLAEAFIRGMNVGDPEEAENTISTILMAGEYLAEEGKPGQWANFDGKEFLYYVDGYSNRETIDIAFTLMGFFGWMTFCGMIERKVAFQIIKSIRDNAPKAEVIEELFRTATEQLVSRRPKRKKRKRSKQSAKYGRRIGVN